MLTRGDPGSNLAPSQLGPPGLDPRPITDNVLQSGRYEPAPKYSRDPLGPSWCIGRWTPFRSEPVGDQAVEAQQCGVLDAPTSRFRRTLRTTRVRRCPARGAGRRYSTFIPRGWVLTHDRFLGHGGGYQHSAPALDRRS